MIRADVGVTRTGLLLPGTMYTPLDLRTIFPSVPERSLPGTGGFWCLGISDSLHINQQDQAYYIRPGMHIQNRKLSRVEST